MIEPFLTALTQAGFKEIAGGQDNPEILKYFDALGFEGDKLHDETSWCMAFVYWALKKCGCQYKRALNARSALEGVGDSIEPDCVQMGDLAIFWRGSHKDELIPGSNLKKGHIGFYVREDDKYVYVYGGNQSNQAKISAYYKSRLLGYIRPLPDLTL